LPQLHILVTVPRWGNDADVSNGHPVDRASPGTQTRAVLMRRLSPSTVDLEPSLESIGVPSYLVDRSGVITWMNDSAIEVFGDVRGRSFTTIVPADSLPQARLKFLRNIFGRKASHDFEAYFLDAAGRRVRVEISSAQVREGGEVVGMFGVLPLVAPAMQPHTELTARQNEVLDLLARGASTEQMAEMLGISTQTVRNHVAATLRTLRVHSRVEAVARARELGMLSDRAA
jgi:PAS domain S-box-containing protein